jgi:hypothetical protein
MQDAPSIQHRVRGAGCCGCGLRACVCKSTSSKVQRTERRAEKEKLMAVKR